LGKNFKNVKNVKKRGKNKEKRKTFYIYESGGLKLCSHVPLTDVLCVSFVYVFHLIKFVSFCCYRIFLANKDIQNTKQNISVCV